MPAKVHVLRVNGHMGDTLMARPVIRAFRAAHPTDRIYLEGPKEHLPLLADLREADFVRPLGASRNVVPPLNLCDFSARPWVRSRTHIMDEMAAAAGVVVQDRSYGLSLSGDMDRWADSEASRIGPFAAFHVQSNLPSKDWALERMSLLASGVRAKLGLKIVQVGGNSDARLPGADEDIRGKTSALQCAAILSRASLFVGPDSGCMHLSRAVRNVPAIVLWGATSPITSGLWGPAVANLDPTRPCAHNGRPCYARCDWTERCVDSLDVDDALAAASRLLKPPAPAPEISVVVVNWNSWSRYTRKFIHRLDDTMSSDWELILVDQGSETDRTYLETWKHPRLSSLLLFSENVGLPAAWNAAIRRAKAPFIALLNTDQEIEEKGWDLEAMAFLRLTPQAGAVGISLTEPPRLFGDHWGKVDLPIEHGRTTRCHHVNGASWVLPRRALDHVGCFDERYSPGYCEETDWCLRACLMGEEIWHLARAFRHEGHGVVRLNKFQIGPVVQRNNAYFAGKWEGARLSWNPSAQILSGNAAGMPADPMVSSLPGGAS